MVRSLRDLNSGQRGNQEDRDRPVESFAGGERSGLAIEQPNNNGGRPTILKLFRNGFILEDGPFRPLSDPVNQKFVESIEKGNAPDELRNRAVNGDSLDVSVVDCRNRDYEAPPPPPTPSYTLFAGEGRALSGDPGNRPTPAQLTPASVDVNSELPQTLLAFRFPNGSRTQQTFNTTATVASLRRYVRDTLGQDNFDLMRGFPPKKIEAEDSITLSEADLLNESIMVKLK